MHLISPLIKYDVSEIECKIKSGVWLFVVVNHNACRTCTRVINQCSEPLKVIAGEKVFTFESGKILIGQFFFYRDKTVCFQPEVQRLIEINNCFYSGG